jgi:hypothetical protein
MGGGDVVVFLVVSRRVMARWGVWGGSGKIFEDIPRCLELNVGV